MLMLLLTGHLTDAQRDELDKAERIFGEIQKELKDCGVKVETSNKGVKNAND